MSKKAILLLACMVFFLWLPIEASAVTVSIPDTNADVGDTVIIPVNIDDATSLFTAAVVLNYDSLVLHCNQAGAGDLIPTNVFGQILWFSLFHKTSPGQVLVIGSGTDKNDPDQTIPGGSGTVFMLACDVIGSPGESTSLEFDVDSGCLLANANADQIPCNAVSGTFTVNTVCTDDDTDGYAVEGGVCGLADCDDTDPAVNPGRSEVTCNGKDDDCNPATPDIVTLDLYISSASAPVSATTGQTISVSDTTNKSGCAIGASTTKIYLSTDNKYSSGDTYLGSRAVPAFGAGAKSSSGSTSVIIPASTLPGSYYIIARADANGVITETNEGNNNRAVSITITSNVDFYVSSVTTSVSVNAGDTVSASDTTNKSGAGVTDTSTTKIYLSTDNKYSSVDTYLGSRAVPAFGAGSQSSSGSTDVTIPANACSQTYYLIARADANGVIGEWNEGNNNKGVSIQITNNTGTAPLPDFYVSGVSAPSSANAGDTISVSDTTNKAGSCAIGASTTKIYLSTNNSYNANDTYLGERAVPAFGEGAQNSSGATSIIIPAGTPAGSYYIIARADANGVIAETNEWNNNRVTPITITGP